MKNILNIFLTDLNNIRKKRAAIVVIVALMILPSMYAWFNILPSWDPYSNTAGVNVAVVSLDEGTTAEGKSFNVGDEIIKSLQDNDKLGWQFVDEESAMRGVEKGDYYASIIIPVDFSKKLSSVLDKDPQKPILDYYINEKINAIAPKVTSAGASGIVESIQQGFVKVTNEVIFTVFNDIGIELETNRGEIEMFRDTVYELEKELPKIRRMINVANRDLDKVDDAVGRVNVGMVRAEKLSKEAGETSKRIEDAIKQGDHSVKKYFPIIVEDLRLSQQVIKEIPAAVNRVHEKGGDVDEFLEKLVDGTEKIDKATDALKQLSNLIEQLDKSLTEDRQLELLNEALREELNRINEFQVKVKDAITKLESGDHLGVDIVKSIDNDVKELQIKLQLLTETYEKVIISTIELQIAELRKQSAAVNELLEKADKKLLQYITKVDSWIEESPVSVEDQREYALKMKEEIEELLGALNDIKEPLENINKINPDPKFEEAIVAIEAIEEELTTVLEILEEFISDGEDLTEGLWVNMKKALVKGQDNIAELKEMQLNISDAFNDVIEELKSMNNQLIDSFTSLQNTVDNIKKITENLVDTVENPEQLIKMLKNTDEKIDEAKSILNTIIEFNDTLQKQFDDGFLLEGKTKVDEVRADLIELKKKVLKITTEAKESKEKVSYRLDDVKQLSIEIDKAISELINYLNKDLMPKYVKAYDKANKAINEGNKLLAKANEYFPKLQEMLLKVDDGVDKGKVGLAKATEVFPEAQEKINDIARKIHDLEKQGDLDKIINLMKNDPTAESDFLADPIFLEEHELFPIPNYGSAMAPFFTAMSLWVGGLILVSSLIVDVPNKQKYKSYEAYFGRFILFWSIGIMQAFIVTMGNMFLLKTYVAHKVMYVLFAFIISTSFVVIIYTFVSVFGNTGKVIAIILLVMQLGASGGTFPIQMTPEFFQKIHAFLPFTHALGLFREAVGGIIWPVVLKHIAWLAAYVAIFLFIGIRLKETINKRSDKFLEEARESDVIL